MNMDKGGGREMNVLNRVALLAVMVGALLFGLRDGSERALEGHPEALWHDGVGQVDAMISEDTQGQVADGLTDSVDFAEGLGEDVTGLAE
jgi:hypothetical protein